jgi:hypothetical protein
MRRTRHPAIVLAALAMLLLATAAAGPPGCGDRAEQPRTVAEILGAVGDTKRDLRARSEITAQQDYDISYRLAEANRSYRAFINDELARLAATGTNAPDPNARRAALRQLAAQLRALRDPGVLGIKSEGSRKLWNEAIAGVGTVIEGIELLGGGD